MKFCILSAIIAGSALQAAAEPQNCPAPGTKDAQGRYSCNPAHQYPAGQTCNLVGGCYFLSGGYGGRPTTTYVLPAPRPTSACPAPGSSDSQGRYSCNPAHQYPGGQTCKLIVGCYVLCGTDGKPVINNPPPAPQPSSGPVCPAPGSSDSQGRYSCNPAHQYPGGQACSLVDGCYVLCGVDGKPVQNSQPPVEPVVTAGAATLKSAGMLVAAGLVAMIM